MIDIYPNLTVWLIVIMQCHLPNLNTNVHTLVNKIIVLVNLLIRWGKQYEPIVQMNYTLFKLIRQLPTMYYCLWEKPSVYWDKKTC